METIRTARRLALATAIAVALAPAAQAATFTVDSTDDTGPGTLRAALEAANGSGGADTIEFDAAIFAAGTTHTIALQSPLTITDHITVTGPGPDVLTLDGGENVRIATITPVVPGIAVALSGLSLRDGFGGGGGGCIGAVNTHLVITDSAFTGCSGGEGPGGALLIADSPVGPPTEGLKGLVFPASLTVRDSRFVGNRAAIGGAISARIEQGGGITVNTVAVEANEAFAYVGGIELITDGGQIVLQDSVISGNVSGGVGGGLGAVSYSTIRIEDTQVTGNQVRAYSYGLYSYGGGAAVIGLGDVLITGSTFQNNSVVVDEGIPARKGALPEEYVGAGGGLFVLPATAGHSLAIENSHFVGNGAGFGGGLMVGMPSTFEEGQPEGKRLKRYARRRGAKALEGDNTIMETRIQDNVSGFGGSGLALLDFSVFGPASTKAVSPGMTLDRVTLSANGMASGSGPIPGALLILGQNWPVQLLNSTVSGNDGGIFVASPTPPAPGEPVLLLDHSTVANNDFGGVIIGGLMSGQPEARRGALAKWAARYKDYPAPELNIAIRNSVLAGNADEESEADLIADPAAVQMLHSLVQTTEPADFTGYQDDGGNQLGVDPLLAPLALAGHAFLEVHVPQSGSPLIDAGDPDVAAATPPETDERGSPRIAGTGIDIGAVETQPGSLGFDPATLAVNETDGTVTLTVVRSGGTDGAVGVVYTLADGTAAAGEDYTVPGGGDTLSWADGEGGAKTIVVPITDDTLVEGDETFIGVLSAPIGGATLGMDTATVTITSEDVAPVGTLALTATAISVNETDGTATLGVSRTGGSNGEVTVDFATADAGATAGNDYTAASGTLAWADGDTAIKNIVVPILDDALVEGPENFGVTLTNATGGAGLGEAAAAVTIVSDDLPPPGTLALAPTELTVNEADGTATFSVTRTGGSAGEVSVGFATANGSAAAGSDYTATTGTLTWADGDTAAKSIVVPILDDTQVEADEQFSLTLTGPTGGASLGAAASTVTIASEDVAPPGTLALAPATLTVNEPDGTAALSVTRSGGSAGEVSVNFATANGSATAGSDYTATTGTLTWADGDTAAKSIVVPILNDTQIEADEQFSLTLTAPTGGASLGAAASTVTIASEDVAPPGTLAIAPAAISVNEPDGTATLSVTRSGGSAGEVSVSFATANGTATAGSDFTATAGTLTWADGDTAAKPIVVPILDDTQVEGDEQFSVTLASPTGGASLGTAAAGVTIVSEDLAPTGSLQFDGVGDDGMVTLRFNEDGTPATPAKALVQIGVTRSGGSAGAASIDFATVDGTATAPADYTATSGTLSWADGESGTKFITVNIVEDGFGENDENFRIVLSNAQGAGLGANAQAQIVVVANGAASSTAPVTIPAGDTRSWLALLGAMLAAAWVGLRRRLG